MVGHCALSSNPSPLAIYGKMPERSNGAGWKPDGPYGHTGSNPVLTAIFNAQD